MIRLDSLPLDNVYVTSQFGLRNLTVNGIKYWWHNGIDLRATVGTPVYAVSDGIIQVAKDNPGGYGLYIALDCSKFGALYAHLNELKVNVRQKVKAGDLIGYSGNSGASEAPHLHLEIRECTYKDFWTRCAVDSQVFMRCVDPAPYLEICKRKLSMTKAEGMKVMKEFADYGDSTIQFFDSYLYRDDLFIKGAKAML